MGNSELMINSETLKNNRDFRTYEKRQGRGALCASSGVYTSVNEQRSKQCNDEIGVFRKSSSFYIGLMSGTSMDGIDVVLLDAPDKLIAAKTYAYPPSIQAALKAWSAQTSTVPDFFQCHRQLGVVFGETVNQFIREYSIDKTTISAIGSHGQTVLHAPDVPYPYTVQMGCGHTIAALTGLTVVADFRMRDVVLGGQGAPLAPLYHQVLFGHLSKPLAVLNIGGIANITILDKGMTGYDVGPGNSLLDAFMQQQFGLPFDKGGEVAARGTVNTALLDILLQDPYFSKPFPKSLDKQDFSFAWLNSHLKGSALSDESVQATLVAFTVEAVKRAVLAQNNLTGLLVCGGGVHNQTLMQALSIALPGIAVKSTEALSVHPDFIEAMMCAWLAQQTLEKIPLDLHPVTGGQSTILGAVFPGCFLPARIFHKS